MFFDQITSDLTVKTVSKHQHCGLAHDYLTHLNVLQNVGLTSIEPVEFQGKSIIPLEFLKQVLPAPESLAKHYSGKTSIGCIIEGKKAGALKKVFLYNICDHQHCFKEFACQAISYTTAIPAVIGSLLYLSGTWKRPGVFNVEQFDPNPFLSLMNQHGLKWDINVL